MHRISADFIKLIIALVVALVVLDPDLAHARAGGGVSMGSRASRTFAAPPPTRTAPQVSPIERSVTPPASGQTARPSAPPANGQPGIGQPGFAQPGFAQRNPFLTSLIGGLVGAGIGGMLFGQGFGGMGGGGMGFSGGLGMLLQAVLLGGAGWWLYSMFRSRGNAPQTFTPAAYTRDAYATPAYPAGVAALDSREAVPLSGGVQRRDEIGVTETDLNEFERLLGAVQQGWSKSDIASLRRVATPEMLSYFSEQLAANASNGLTDTITDIKLDQADLAEAWCEAGVDYATVALRFSALDYTTAEDGRVTRGSTTARSEATESWTFMRQSSGPRGAGRWLLAAIQQ
jgi:predicted lipid-binding transport protein (Tim44 family)